MSKRDLIVRELERIPDAALDDVLNYVLSLTRPLSEGMETAIASESALRKIWLTPEEDEAWADL